MPPAFSCEVITAGASAAGDVCRSREPVPHRAGRAGRAAESLPLFASLALTEEPAAVLGRVCPREQVGGGVPLHICPAALPRVTARIFRRNTIFLHVRRYNK